MCTSTCTCCWWQFVCLVDFAFKVMPLVLFPHHTTSALSRSSCCKETGPGIYGEHKKSVYIRCHPAAWDFGGAFDNHTELKKTLFNLYGSRFCHLCHLPLDSAVCACVRAVIYICLPLCETVSICMHVCVSACVRAHEPCLPALKHQQQITDGPPALEVFYFPAEARYVKNKHVQH